MGLFLTFEQLNKVRELSLIRMEICKLRFLEETLLKSVKSLTPISI
jgi:hypothetical protein